ncbi:MAG: hypothetical protein WDM90_20600 [Ferruginibacter sp.]
MENNEELKDGNLNNRGKIIPVNIEEQMKTSYIDYSMSVIVGRALPDVRDGFKPVHPPRFIWHERIGQLQQQTL